MESLFSKMVRGEVPCHKVYEDEKTMAFLDIYPKTKGHVLVIPKKQSEGIFDIDPVDMHACADTAQKIARSMKNSLGITGVNIFQNTGADAQQTVFHYHLHVMPRYHDDQAILFAQKEENSPFEEIAKTIREGLA